MRDVSHTYLPTGQLQSENKARRNGSETPTLHNYVQSLYLLRHSALESMFPRLAMNTYDGQPILLSQIQFQKPDKTPNPLKLPRGISNVAAKYRPRCMEIALSCDGRRREPNKRAP